jgi:hypothetical protein
MEQMAKDAGLEMAFMAEEEVGDQEGEFEALGCVSLLNTVVLKVDSGASKHFLAGDVHLHEKPSHVSVQTASKDGVMAMDVNGTLEGTVAGTLGAVGLMLNAEKSGEMAHSLFSVREAVRAGLDTQSRSHRTAASSSAQMGLASGCGTRDQGGSCTSATPEARLRWTPPSLHRTVLVPRRQALVVRCQCR